MKIPNTFGLDVEAAVFLEYDSVEELERLIAAGYITSPFSDTHLTMQTTSRE